MNQYNFTMSLGYKLRDTCRCSDVNYNITMYGFKFKKLFCMFNKFVNSVKLTDTTGLPVSEKQFFLNSTFKHFFNIVFCENTFHSFKRFSKRAV